MPVVYSSSVINRLFNAQWERAAQGIWLRGIALGPEISALCSWGTCHTPQQRGLLCVVGAVIVLRPIFRTSPSPDQIPEGCASELTAVVVLECPMC